jgi:hypothetical protein
MKFYGIDCRRHFVSPRPPLPHVGKGTGFDDWQNVV